MGTTSLEFDDLIVTGLCMTKADLDQWQLELPPRLRLKVADVINAPKWSELTDEEIMKGTVASTSAATLNGWSLRFGVRGILAIIFGGVLGYLVESSTVTALWRLAVISLIAIVIWLVWSGWHRSFFFQLARRVRGFLAWRLPPFWTSWLYEAKSRRPKPDVAIPTITRIVLDRLAELAIALVCAICVGKPIGSNCFWSSVKTTMPKAKRGYLYCLRGG